MIIQVALPLVAEHGAAVTTQQIARAAGIGEATIFRAFTDKDTLIRACVAEAVRPDHLVRELASIDLDQELEARLIEAAEALSAYLGRMGAVVGALAATGAMRPPPDAAQPERGRDDSTRVTTGAIQELLEPDGARFRLPLEVAAATFGALVMSLGRVPRGEDGPLVDAPGMVDLFLHGALSG